MPIPLLALLLGAGGAAGAGATGAALAGTGGAALAGAGASAVAGSALMQKAALLAAMSQGAGGAAGGGAQALNMAQSAAQGLGSFESLPAAGQAAQPPGGQFLDLMRVPSSGGGGMRDPRQAQAPIQQEMMSELSPDQKSQRRWGAFEGAMSGLAEGGLPGAISGGMRGYRTSGDLLKFRNHLDRRLAGNLPAMERDLLTAARYSGGDPLQTGGLLGKNTQSLMKFTSGAGNGMRQQGVYDPNSDATWMLGEPYRTGSGGRPIKARSGERDVLLDPSGTSEIWSGAPRSRRATGGVTAAGRAKAASAQLHRDRLWAMEPSARARALSEAAKGYPGTEWVQEALSVQPGEDPAEVRRRLSRMGVETGDPYETFINEALSR